MQELTRQRDHVTTVTTEYQMTLQMMETFFKNLTEVSQFRPLDGTDIPKELFKLMGRVCN